MNNNKYQLLEKQAQEQFTTIFNSNAHKDSKLHFTNEYCQFDAFIINKENKTIQIIELKKRTARYQSDACEFKKIFALYKATKNDYSLLNKTTFYTLDSLKSLGYKISWSLISMWEADKSYRIQSLDKVFTLINELNISFVSKKGMYKNADTNIELKLNQYIINAGDETCVDRFNIMIDTKAILKKYSIEK